MLSSIQIAGLFDHQYLWKECIAIFTFLQGDIQQRKAASGTITFCSCPGRSNNPQIPKPRLALSAFGWSGGMARLKIVHNKRSVSSLESKRGFFSRFNPFSTNVPLLYPSKTSENRTFSDVFRGYGIGTLVENGLIHKVSNY